MLVTYYPKQKNQSGFTMVEVLITLVIMAIGLLGIALIQIIGMKNNHSAYLRTQVTTLSNQYADMLRSNTDARDTFVADGSSFLTSDTPPTTTASCTTTTGCTPQQMAETDIANWVTQVQQILPSGNAIVNRAGNTFEIRIFWLDERDKTDEEATGKEIDIDGDGTVDSGYERYKVFVTSFQP